MCNECPIIVLEVILALIFSAYSQENTFYIERNEIFDLMVIQELSKMLKPKAVEFRISLWKIFYKLSDKNNIPKSGLNFLISGKSMPLYKS